MASTPSSLTLLSLAALKRFGLEEREIDLNMAAVEDVDKFPLICSRTLGYWVVFVFL